MSDDWRSCATEIKTFIFKLKERIKEIIDDNFVGTDGKDSWPFDEAELFLLRNYIAGKVQKLLIKNNENLLT
ncbi:hypothetical protein [Oceanobacillus alkalisoli]|uniref:hypothetical protein n=1 Tax=Oceanobacillus alkalisoli TaxID=2925113 RepID=UPI001EE479FA|nr:hypothetical protein [Oceanobacillus alkalisoli]MCG5105168.1 hypothetical protein [Oceanobacillus alkalisoli]